MSIATIGRSFLLIIIFSPVLAVAKESHLAALQRMIDEHTVIVQSQVLSNWNLPPVTDIRLSSAIEVQSSMNGEVTATRMVRSSGNPDFDRAVEEAISNSSPLPVVADPEVMDQFRKLQFEFRLGDFIDTPAAPANTPTGYSNYPHVKSPVYIDK